jgi:sRNA-binding carbon storage regulator CsrA
MLIVSRKDTESLVIELGAGIDPATSLKDLFAAGPIEIKVFESLRNRVKIGIQAPRQLSIRREGDAPAKPE